jgi:hypothetical protein
MKRDISEELPERKHRQADAKPSSGDENDKKEGGGKAPEERIRQAVYDIRYRARREELPLTQAFSQYMQNSNMSQVEKSAVRKKLAGNSESMGENYNIENLASDNVAKALYKVFVEGNTNTKNEIFVSAKELYLEQETKERKYKVRVTGKDGKSYVRYATREKINQLRANPNIESVEMTQYGEPYEGEKKRGEQTAAAKRGSKLDPVGQEDSDIDNDGKENTSRDKYLRNRREVRGAVIATRKEEVEFIGEIKAIQKNNKKIDVMKGKNPVIINPPESKSLMAHTEVEGEVILENGYSKFLGMLQEKKMTSKEKKKEKKLKNKYDKSGMKASMKKQYGERGEDVYFATIRKQSMGEESDCGCEDEEPKLKKSEGGVTDSREIPTKVNLMKNKLRAMGLKMSYEPEGEKIDEVLGGQSGDGYIGHPRLGIKNPLNPPVKGGAKVAPKNTGLAGRLGNRASQMDAAMQQLRQSYEPEGEMAEQRRPYYRTTSSGRKVRWDEDERIDDAVSRKLYPPKPGPGTSSPGSLAKPAD